MLGLLTGTMIFMKNILLFVTLLLITVACNKKEDTFHNIVKYNPNDKSCQTSPDELFSSLEIIPLEGPEDVIIDTESNVIYDNNRFYIIDAIRRKRIDIFNAQGQYISSIKAFGRSGNEYIGIDHVQLLDSLVAVYSCHNKALYYFDINGTFVKKEPIQYAPLDLLKVQDGYWGYVGNAGEIPARIVKMDMKGKIIEKYLPVSKIIPLTEESSVFIPYKGDLLIRETLRSDIFKIDSTGNAHTFISFDFGRYNVPRSYFENNDPVAAATKLMQSDIAIMDRFFVNDDYMVLSVDFQMADDSDAAFSSLGICHRDKWKWLRSEHRGALSMFYSTTKALTQKSALIILSEAQPILDFKKVYPELVPEFNHNTDNSFIVLCHLKE